MASSYPGGYDSFTGKSNGPGHTVDASHINALQDAVAAIQATLGLNPQGSSATVAERIAAVESGASTFAPSQLTWSAAYWTEDPGWTAPADGGNVTAWRDYSGGVSALSTFSVAPTLTAANSALNGKPTVDFLESSTQALRTATDFTQAQPFSVFAVLADWNASSGSNQGALLATSVQTGPQILAGTTSQAGIYAGFGIARAASPQSSTGAHAWAFVVDGASSKIVKDGTGAAVSGNPGANYFGGSTFKIALGNRGGSENGGNGLFGTAKIAFIGIYNGDITADAKWGDLKTWTASHYGLTIA
jgi:hypothetical protein